MKDAFDNSLANSCFPLRAILNAVGRYYNYPNCYYYPCDKSPSVLYTNPYGDEDIRVEITIEPNMEEPDIVAYVVSKIQKRRLDKR